MSGALDLCEYWADEALLVARLSSSPVVAPHLVGFQLPRGWVSCRIHRECDFAMCLPCVSL